MYGVVICLSLDSVVPGYVAGFSSFGDAKVFLHNELCHNKTCLKVSDQVRHEQALQPQNMARGLELRIQKEEGLHYTCSEIKCTDQLCSFPSS